MSDKKKKPSKARRQTERDLKRLDDAVEKCALAIGGRFGDIDQSLVDQADGLLNTVRDWAQNLREYMDELEAEGQTWELLGRSRMPKTIPATPWEMEHHPHRGAEAHGYISVNDANGNPIFDTSNASYKLAMQMDEGEGEQKWYERGLEPALQLAAAAPLLRKQLKEAVGVLAAIHDAENGKTRADQGIVTLAGRACDEARAALAAAGDAQAGPSDLEKAVLDLTCAACDNQIRWKLHTWQECAVCAPVRRALAGEPL